MWACVDSSATLANGPRVVVNFTNSRTAPWRSCVALAAHIGAIGFGHRETEDNVLKEALSGDTHPGGCKDLRLAPGATAALQVEPLGRSNSQAEYILVGLSVTPPGVSGRNLAFLRLPVESAP